MDSILNIAHRGARSLAPENTLVAARKALDVGADMWELDVALTADGVPYLVHDDTLERTSNVAEVFPERRPWPCHAFTIAEIRQLDFGSWFNQRDPFGQIAAGQVSEADQQSYIGEPAPTLEEALAFTRDHNWRVNVEIKDASGTPGDADIVAKVVGLIERMTMIERVLISSFNHTYLKQVKARNPRLTTGALIEYSLAEPLPLLYELAADALHPQAGLFPLDVITAWRDAGFGVNIWTVNDPVQMKALVEARVSGIFTDFPQTLHSILYSSTSV